MKCRMVDCGPSKRPLTEDDAAERLSAAADGFVCQSSVVSNALRADTNVDVHDVCYSGVNIRAPAQSTS